MSAEVLSPQINRCDPSCLSLDSTTFDLIRIAEQSVQIRVSDPQQRQVEILGQQPRDFIT